MTTANKNILKNYSEIFIKIKQQYIIFNHYVFKLGGMTTAKNLILKNYLQGRMTESITVIDSFFKEKNKMK